MGSLSVKSGREDCCYDVVASLGGNCSVAFQLMHRGKRPCAYALDWTLMDDARAITYLPEGIRTRFSAWCQKENLIEYDEPGMEHGKKVFRYEDKLTGFRFMHHFHGAVEEGSCYADAKKKLDCRMVRFYESMSKAKRAFLILSMKFPIAREDAQKILEALDSAFPGVYIRLRVLMFADRTQVNETFMDGRLEICSYIRPLDLHYDMYYTAPEWKFLDDLHLTGEASVRDIRKKLPAKYKYKIWKAIGRWLERHGYGCANLIFD